MRTAECGILVGLIPPHPRPLARSWWPRGVFSDTPPGTPGRRFWWSHPRQPAPTRPFPTPQGPREHRAVGRPPRGVAGRSADPSGTWVQIVVPSAGLCRIPPAPPPSPSLLCCEGLV